MRLYSDSGNIMLSYITDTTDVKSTFDRYLELLAGYLRDTGVNAVKSGRNDIHRRHAPRKFPAMPFS